MLQMGSGYKIFEVLFLCNESSYIKFTDQLPNRIFKYLAEKFRKNYSSPVGSFLMLVSG